MKILQDCSVVIVCVFDLVFVCFYRYACIPDRFMDPASRNLRLNVSSPDDGIAREAVRSETETEPSSDATIPSDPSGHIGSSSLPYDVFLRLADFLPGKDLVRGLSGTNRHLNGLIKEEAFWKRRIKTMYDLSAYPILSGNVEAGCGWVSEAPQRLPCHSAQDWQKRACQSERERNAFCAGPGALSSKTFRAVAQGHRINAMSFVGNGAVLATGGNDYRVTLWDLEKAMEEGMGVSEDMQLECGRTVIHKHADWVTSLECREGKLSSGSMDRTIRIFDVAALSSKLHVAPTITLRSGRGIFCHDWDRDLIAAGMHSAVQLFDIRASSAPIMSKIADDEELNLIWDVALDDNRIFLVSTDATLRLVNIRNRRTLNTARMPTGEHGTRMDVRDGCCFIGTNNSAIRAYGAMDLELIHDYSSDFAFAQDHRVVGLHHNSAHILACSTDGSLKMLEASRKPKLLWQWESDLDLMLRAMAFAPDCSLAVCCADRVVVWRPTGINA